MEAPIAIDTTAGEATLAELVESIVTVEKLIAQATGWRTRLLELARQLGELPDVTGEPRLPHGWDEATVARRTVSSELAVALRIPERSVDKLLLEAHVLSTTLPATMQALGEGELTYRHAQRIVDQALGLDDDDQRALDDALLPAATTQTVAQLDRSARAVRESLKPEPLEERHARALDDRRVVIEPVDDGMSWLHALLPAEKAAGIRSRVTDLALSLAGPDEKRSLGQRRADVLADLLIDGEVSDLAPGIRAKVLVTVPVLTLLGTAELPATLEGYGPIDPATARELAAHAPSFTRILTHPETDAILRVGRDSYAVPADLRLWLRVRDERCRFPGCEAPAVDCDIDHSLDWAGGGPSDHDNLAHLCGPHHRLKHHTAWKLKQLGAGVLEWTSPTGRVSRVHPAQHLPAA